MFYVYTHSTDLGEVFYVGKGSKKRAWSVNQRSKKHQRVSWTKGCVVEIVQHFEVEQEALAYEIQLIEFFGTFSTDWSNLTLGCNFTVGGDDPPKGHRKGKKCTPEQRKKMSNAHLGVRLGPQSPEHITKRVEARRRNNTLKHSDETKKFISYKLLGNQNARKKS